MGISFFLQAGNPLDARLIVSTAGGDFLAWIPKGEESGLLTPIATTESVTLCEQTKS